MMARIHVRMRAVHPPARIMGREGHADGDREGKADERQREEILRERREKERAEVHRAEAARWQADRER